MPDVGFSAASLQSSEQFAPYSKVVLKTDDYDSSQAKTFTAGDDSGRTLEAVLPWASQEVADSILESIRGYAYQPINAKGVIIDPATELGDDITVGGVKGFIENQDIKFGGILRADIAAPGEEQIDHEFQFIVKRDRKTARNFGAVGAAIRETQKGLRTATESLTADIGDVQAGLYAVATADDINKWKEANTTMFAQFLTDKEALQAGIDSRVTYDELNDGDWINANTSIFAQAGGKQAAFDLWVAGTSGGQISSGATLVADTIELRGKLNVLGSMDISNGRLTVDKSIYTGANVFADKFWSNSNAISVGGADLTVKASAVLGTNYISLAGTKYVPTEITSTTGVVMALGCA